MRIDRRAMRFVMLAAWLLLASLGAFAETVSEASETVLWAGYTDELLRLRQEPSVESEKIVVLRKARPVVVLEERDGWLFVRAGQRLGWVSGNYVSRGEPSPAEFDEGERIDCVDERGELLRRIAELERSERSERAPSLEDPELEERLALLQAAASAAYDLKVELEAERALRTELESRLAALDRELEEIRRSETASDPGEASAPREPDLAGE